MSEPPNQLNKEPPMPSALHHAAEMRIRKSAIQKIKFHLEILFGKPEQAMPFIPVKPIPESRPSWVDGLLSAVK
jgi:hypothetical protein